ncbi:hypothetical protein DFR33_101627 [Bradymonas sediminis]|nr:hypothetical protein DFR33_101627 [Bradymonas sediminis]
MKHPNRYAARLRFLIVMGFLGVFVSGCGGSMGTLENERADSIEAFDEDLDVFYKGADDPGIWRVALGDGSKEKLFDKKYSLIDVSLARDIWVFNDSDLNFYMQRPGDRNPEKFKAFEGLLGQAAIAPDASRVALTRIRHLDGPTNEMGDSRIYFVDLNDLKITKIETPIRSWMTQLSWSRDGRSLIVGTFDQELWRVDPSSGASTEVADPQELVGQYHPKAGGSAQTTCPGEGGATLVQSEWGADEGIALELADGTSSPLVTISGRERGFHDYQATVSTFFFTPSCKNVVFAYDTRVWIVSVETLLAYEITAGRYPFLL